MPSRRNPNRKTWTRAWLLIAVPAVALVVYGLVTSGAQARALGALRLEQANKDAEALARSADFQIRETLVRTLSRSAAHYNAKRRDDPFAGRREAPWLGDIYVWNGRILTRWPVAATEPMSRGADPAKKIADLLSKSAASPRPSDRTLRFATVDPIGQPRMIAWLAVRPAGAAPPSDADDRPLMLAIAIDTDQLKATFLDNHFARADRLKLVRQDELKAGAEFYAISAATPWAVIIHPGFHKTQARNRLIPVAVYATVAAVFLIALILTLRQFINLVEREIALTNLKSDFVAGVSHELKTPLALIQMFSEMLRENRVKSEDKIREYYDIIYRESARLTLMIDNILDFSRIEAGKKEFNFEPTDVGEVVRDTYEAYRFELDDKSFTHAIRIEENLPIVDADANAIAQVLVNLIGNAIKYSADEKVLDIRVTSETRRDRHGVLITITDAGIGIKPEDRAHLFDGFYRAQDDRVRRVRGAGLGLSLVKRVVDAHHGIVDVESRLVKGSTFRVFLPQTRTHAPNRRDADPEPVHEQSKG